MRSVRWSGMGVLAAGALAAATAAGAEPDGAADAKQATAFFEQGIALYGDERYIAAESAFQKAWDLHPTHDTAANLGDCELRVGQQREAAEHLAFALTTFPLSGDEALRKRLEEGFEEAKKEVATIRVKVNMEGAAIVAAGRRVGYAPLSKEIFLDPGETILQVSLAGYTPYSSTLALKKGEARDVAVTLSPLEPPARSVLPLIVGAGVTAVALGTGVALIAASGGARSDAEAQGAALDRTRTECPDATHGAQCDELRSTLERRDTLGNASIVAFAIAGVALAGTLGYVLWPRAKPQASALQVRPAVGLAGGGAIVTGSF